MNQYQKEFIINNYSRLSQKELANELSVSATIVFRWLRELKLRRVYNPNTPAKKTVHNDGFFYHDRITTI